MARRASNTPTQSRATVRPIESAPSKGVQPMTFTAVPVDRATMPKPGKRGGRQSNLPAIEAFLQSCDKPGVTYQMGSPDEDGGHPVNRVTQVRKLAGETFKVETSPIESGKRYLVFVTLAG